MVVQKKKSRKAIRVALLSVLMVSAMSAASVFLRVNAAEEIVSATDESLFLPIGVSEESEDEETPDDAEPADEEEVINGEIEEITPDFIELTADDIIDFVDGRFLPSASFKGSFYSELKEAEKRVYDGYVTNYVVGQKNEAFTVDLSGFGYTSSDTTSAKDAIISAAAAFAYDHPEIFWIRSFGYSLTCQSGNVTSVTITSNAAYNGAYAQLDTVQYGINNTVAQLDSAIASTSGSRYDILKVIHDYICNNVSYDNVAAAYGTANYGYAYTAAPLFGGGSRGKQFVCEGYSKAFKILCDRYEIPCVLVSGTAKATSGDGNHMWNYVQMDDGKWYGVDTTWDDQSIIYDTYFLVGSNTNVFNGKRFGQDHIPVGQVMVTDTMAPLVYPALSAERYDPTSYADSIELDRYSATVKIGETLDLIAAVKPDIYAGTVKWKSSNTKVATVTLSGRVKGISSGTATITVTAGSVSANCTVKVERSVTITKTELLLIPTRSKPNPTSTLSVKITGSSVSKTWYSDNTEVATVTSAGKVTAVGSGTANIYCKSADGVISAPCVVTVDPFIIGSTEDNITGNVLYVKENESCPLTISSAAHGSIMWKSSNTKVASIDSASGIVKGVGKGTVTITATAADKTKETIKLTVVRPTTSLKLNNTAPSIYVKGSVTLRATRSTNSNDPIYWSTSDPTVASVSSSGLVKGLSRGTAMITARTFSGVSATAVVTVRTKATSIVFDQVVSAVLVNGADGTNEGTLIARIASPAECNDTIKWSTGNRNIATVTPSADGKSAVVKAVKKGTVTITARTGSGKTVSRRITVVNEPATSIAITKSSVSLYVGASSTLKTQVLPRLCNDVVTWSSSDSKIASVDQNGKVKAIAQGEATIYAATLFGQRQAETKVTVRTRAKSISVDQSAVSVKKGDTVELNVTAMSPAGCNDTITWTSGNKNVAAVQASADGKSAVVTGSKKGTATITVKTGSGKSQRIKITVTN